MKIVVIGGTGLIGSKVVEKLKQRGHDALAAAPNTGVDIITGKGLAEALAGAEVVVDVSNSPSFEEKAATDFFQTADQVPDGIGLSRQKSVARAARKFVMVGVPAFAQGKQSKEPVISCTMG